MTYRLEHDPQSGAFYIRVREGEYRETIPLDEPGYGAGVDVDAEGNVLGFEFLSFEEYAEVVARHGGELEIPDVVENPNTPHRYLRRQRRNYEAEVLWEAISSLPVRQQDLIRLRFEEGLSKSEIADQLGISVESAHRELLKAINKLRKVLEANTSREEGYAAGEDVSSDENERALEAALSALGR